ncbi:lipid II isoglutaminyl synthase subunit MurT [Streptococcus sp. S784/96/1]|uniref:lipid II isoglutaminyl synthase subunit MurT n=1 Tax=Streptococcus sp. S784/96/1 TaxID=2653499 RepID=UPI001389423A|nr:lipid II isoglutaminyl synthase subunit MurT [Streptococcus sp. S784/96/1]
MTIKTKLGILAGKSAHFILSQLGRGSTLPGKIALKFDKDILSSLAQDYEIVVVTGTNGKTLTTALTVGILKEAFGEIVTNPSGANMITGITSTFLTAKKGKSGKKIAVLEIDEASLPKITEYITPSLFVFTNIFRDQMDRYGEIYTTYQMILDGAAKAPQATILANGDSPLFNSKQVVNPVRFYGFDTEKAAPALAHYNTEGIVCPNCEGILQYTLNTYANLGDYICPNCDFKRPELNYKLTALKTITNTASEFVIDGQDYKINVGGLYNIYNALAAVSVAEFFGVSPEKIKAGFDQSRAVFGRQETFKIGNKSCTLVLIKNPVGASQALEMIKLADYPFSLSVLLNANYADGIDTSWIWDANFELINEMDITEINAGGVRHSEIARRLRVTGYDEIKITQAEKLEDIMDLIETQESDHAYILATYTAMLEFRELLAQRHAVGKEMN